MTHSVVGALPLGIITSDETTATLSKAFRMYQDILPPMAFFGNVDGPSIIMTDNCSELREALRSVWPKATLLLCLFHIIQQVWKWLNDKKNLIDISDRKSLMAKFKSLAYQTDTKNFEDKYESIMAIQSNEDDDNVNLDEEDEWMLLYPQYTTYLASIDDIKRDWALCYR